MSDLRLRKERIEREWTQLDVAIKLGVSPQVVCDWEKGRRFPRRPVLLELEKLFGMSHQLLFAPEADGRPFSSTN